MCMIFEKMHVKIGSIMEVWSKTKDRKSLCYGLFRSIWWRRVVNCLVFLLRNGMSRNASTAGVFGSFEGKSRQTKKRKCQRIEVKWK